MINMIPIESSMITHLGHDEATNILRVRFKKGEQEWDYLDVSKDDFNSLINAKSIGSHFHKNIRSKFEGKKIIK